MGRFEVGDYVIWRQQKICQIESEHVPAPLSLFGSQVPTLLRGITGIRPAGLTEADWTQICNDTTRWRVMDCVTQELFRAEGFDLLYVNELQLLALMAGEDGKDDERRTEFEG